MRKRISDTVVSTKEKKKGKVIPDIDLSEVLSLNKLDDVVLNVDALRGQPLILKSHNGLDGITIRWYQDMNILDVVSTEFDSLSIRPVAYNRVELKLERDK